MNLAQNGRPTHRHIVAASLGRIHQASYSHEGCGLFQTIGAAIPLGVLYGLYNQVIKYVMTKFHLLTGFLQFLDAWHVFRILIPVGVGLGIGIGFIGSMISVRKHLRV